MYRLAGVRAKRVTSTEGRMTIEAVSTAAVAAGPGCGQAATRVHSRYVRTLQDLPSSGQPVRVRLTVRRFRCGTAHWTCFEITDHRHYGRWTASVRRAYPMEISRPPRPA